MTCGGVFFATPSLSWQVSLEYLRSMVNTATYMAQQSVKHTLYTLGGNSFVCMARNALVAEFLENEMFKDFTDFFFLDDDIGWPPEKVTEFLQRKEDIVAGVYPRKWYPVDYPCNAVIQNGCLVERDGLIKVTAAPTGFMRIKRSALAKMYYDAKPYTEEVQVDGLKERRYLFSAGYVEGVGWRGEDFQFCADWINKYGGEIWVDPNINFTHRGTHMFQGNLFGKIQEMINDLSAGDAARTVYDLGLAEAAQ